MKPKICMHYLISVKGDFRYIAEREESKSERESQGECYERRKTKRLNNRTQPSALGPGLPVHPFVWLAMPRRASKKLLLPGLLPRILRSPWRSGPTLSSHCARHSRTEYLLCHFKLVPAPVKWWVDLAVVCPWSISACCWW